MLAHLKKTALTGMVALFAAIGPAAAAPPSALGLWQMLDDDTHEPVTWFLFVEHNGVYDGVIAKYFIRPGIDKPNQICSACQDDRHNQPLLGLPLVTGMQRHGLAYENGKILDPRNGNTYNALMHVSPDGKILTVRGYLGFSLFGQDQTWYRLPDSAYSQLDPTIISRYLPGRAAAIKPAPARRHLETTARSGGPVR
jgi:uncharacterized protein (DUF2147 family)